MWARWAWFNRGAANRRARAQPLLSGTGASRPVCRWVHAGLGLIVTPRTGGLAPSRYLAVPAQAVRFVDGCTLGLVESWRREPEGSRPAAT